MRIPVPNPIGLSLPEAKKKLMGYDCRITYRKTHFGLPDTVLDYTIDAEKECVHLSVSMPEDTAFTLEPASIASVTKIGKITGKNGFNEQIMDEAGVGSTDLGIPVDLGDQIAFLYGDSFSGPDVNQGAWNSNFMALADFQNWEKGMHFSRLITGSNDKVKPLFQGQHDENLSENLILENKKEVTKIPTGGIRIGSFLYVYGMSVRYWGKPGEWFVTENALWKADFHRLDEFQKTGLSFTETDYPFAGQLFPFLSSPSSPYIHLLATPGGRFGRLSLLRVKREEIENIDAYEVLVKKDTYIPVQECRQKTPYSILPGVNASEPSIAYDEYLGEWLVSMISPKGLHLYHAKDFQGPFCDSYLVLTAKECPQFYGGFLSPIMMRNQGKKVYLQVSQWSPIYNTSLYEVTFR